MMASVKRGFSRIQSGRRNFIRLIGVGCVLSVTGTAGAYQKILDTSGADIINEDDPRYRWLMLAARAPSSHNMQPWLVDLSVALDTLMLYADATRFLPKADPQARQTMISLGGFMELLCLLAQSDGNRCEVSLFPQGPLLNAPIAQLKIIPADTRSSIKDDLSSMIPYRYTNQGIYAKNRPVSSFELNTLLDKATCYGVVASGSVQPEQVSCISQRAAAAWEAELTDEAIMLETLSVTRIGRHETETSRDGIAIQGFWPELAASLGMFRRDKVPAADSISMKKMRTMGKEQAGSASGWIWLSTNDNTREQQIAAGQAFVTLSLAAAQLGIALHPMSQALENHLVMQEQHKGLYEDLGINPAEQTIQILARIGYAKPKPLSLRRLLEHMIKRNV